MLIAIIFIMTSGLKYSHVHSMIYDASKISRKSFGSGFSLQAEPVL